MRIKLLTIFLNNNNNKNLLIQEKIKKIRVDILILMLQVGMKTMNIINSNNIKIIKNIFKFMIFLRFIEKKHHEISYFCYLKSNFFFQLLINKNKFRKIKCFTNNK